MKAKLLLIALFYGHVVHSKPIAPQTHSAQKTAVLIVGNDASTGAVRRMDALGYTLQYNGIRVHKYYYPYANWNTIKESAKTCSFFIYTGHGFSNGGLSGGYGGMYINDFIYAKELLNGLLFLNKPLVIYLNACGAAGSASTDLYDIGIQEANKRVCDTALPYFMVGAGAYFASNLMSYEFINFFFKGKTLQTCFRIFAEPQYEIFIDETISSKNALNSKKIGIAGYKVEHKKAQYYHIAFIGPENFTIQSIVPFNK